MTTCSPWTMRLAAGARRLAADEHGGTAIEYGLLVAGIGLAVSATFFSVGNNVKVMLYERLLNMWGGG